MSKEHYVTQLFEHMRENGIKGTMGNVTALKYEELSEFGQMEFNFLHNVFLGRLKVTKDKCDYSITSVTECAGKYSLQTFADAKAFQLQQDCSSTGITTHCDVEEYGELQSLVAGGECVAIWPIASIVYAAS